MTRAAAAAEAAARGDAARLATLLRADNRLANAVDENGCSLLQRAAADGHVEVVQLLLQHGADPNRQDLVHGNTALHEASWKGYSRCAAALAAAGADLAARNAGGFAPLHLACQNGHNQTCRELLIAGAPPDLQNNYGDTSLHTAARYGHAGVTRILLSAASRPALQNKNGDSALHIAAAMARRKLTRILLQAGCDKALRNLQGETARDIANRKGLDEIIAILNTPVAKVSPKKKRDKSSERVLDEVDAKPKDKGKKKKNVTFDTPPPAQWSPYGCHYYPDPKFFPKPKLSSLPTEPLQKGEQYYLDLAGNIRKGPIGAGYTCYCAPFFKHMEDKMSADKKDIKKHMDREHEKLDQKVTDLEMKTKGQISELTRFVAAERAMCKERHQHLEQWLTRGMMFRASERVRKLDFSPKGSLDIPPLQRTRSLEVLDSQTQDWNHVGKIIRNFNRNSEYFESPNLHDKDTSKSSELLDQTIPTTQRNYLRNSKSSDQLDSSSRNSSMRNPRSLNASSRASPVPESSPQNVTAEIHVKANRVSISQSPTNVEVSSPTERVGATSRLSNPKSPSCSTREIRASDSEGERSRNSTRFSPQPPSMWKSQVLQRTTDDIRKRVLEKEMSEAICKSNKSLDISQDGYVKFQKSNCPQMDGNTEVSRRSVQELVARVEQQQIRGLSPEPMPLPRKSMPTEVESHIAPVQPSPSILKMPQQPLRPAPMLKEKQPKSKRFSLHNLIPFPTRKTFQNPSKDSGNNSESSDEEDNPIRTSTQPGPMRNSNLLQTLPMPNYETMSNTSSPPPQHLNANYPAELRSMIPKDAYFHEIPNRQMPFLPEQSARDRGPLRRAPAAAAAVLDAMMQDHIMREMDRIPHFYSEHLNQNTEVEIAQNEHFRDQYYSDRPPIYPNVRKPIPDHNLLHSRLQSLAINTHLTDTHSQADRESHNDSGYSTKVYGSSQGPSPSLSGHIEDNLSGQRINIMPNGKGIHTHIGASSLV